MSRIAATSLRISQSTRPIHRYERARAASLGRSNKGRWLRWLSALLVFLAIPWSARGSETDDSSWRVSGPIEAFDVGRPADPTVRIAIKQLLRETPGPLIDSPPPARQPALGVPQTSVTEASRPPSSDGWRSAGSAANPRPALEVPAPADTHAADESTAAALPSTVDSSASREPATKSLGPLLRAVERSPQTEPEADNTTSDVEPQRAEPDVDDAEPPVLENPRPAAPLPPLTRNMQFLRNKVRRVLKGYYSKPLNSRENDPWEMMHGMLAYELESRVRQDGPRGQLITLVGWLCYNKPSKGMTLLQVTPQGELRAKYGVGLQGHMGQFLAMLAQCNVSPDYPILVGQHEFTIHDLVEAEKVTCYPNQELTFKLLGLMHYLESDAQWVNDQGEPWSIERLIQEELAQPIRGAACGGTHRLSGLSLAARKRVERGEPLDGEFARAAEYVRKYHNYAFQLQNRDGSLSTEWFRGRGDDPDLDRRIKTTGHILEWLTYSLSDEELRYPRTIRAVSYLANLMYGNFDHEWEIGPRSHALHALRVYDERVFQPYDELEDVAAGPARRPATSRAPSRSRQR